MRHYLLWSIALAVAAAATSAYGQEETFTVYSDELSDESASAREAANRLVEHYLRMYGEHLESGDWIARAMAVVGLARIRDERITDRLLEVMEEDGAPVVRAYACEGVFARCDDLTEAQRQRWIQAGLKLAQRDALHGDLRVALVRMMRDAGPTPMGKKLFSRLFANTNSMDSDDMRTLWAMRDVVARWMDGSVLQALVGAMSNLNDAYRAEFILSGIRADVPRVSSLLRKGSDAMWEETQQAWNDWLASTDLGQVGTRPGSTFTRGSTLMPEPEPIRDPADLKWRKDLELRPLRLADLDVAFVIDSTASMTPVVEWIKRDVAKMMRAFAMISREPRIGLTFYRDHGDDYVAKRIPLTGNGRSLARSIRNITAEGGGDIPEAVFEAAHVTVHKQNWASSRRMVIVVGDAPPHENTMKRLTRLVEGSTEEGYRFYFIKARTRWGGKELSDFDHLGALSGGSSVWINFHGGYTDYGRGGPDSPPDRHVLARIASVDRSEKADRYVVGEVLRSVLSEPYHDRVDAFVNVLLEYVERSTPERREPFPPAPPPRPDDHRRPGRPQPEPPPRNPQLE